MNNKEAWALYSSYLSAWNTTSIADRSAITHRVLDANLQYLTARHDLSRGRALVLEDIATFHERFPGGHFEIGDVSAHHNVAVLSWVIIQEDGAEFARGVDQIESGADGKISKITTFPPSERILT